jgi:hypothetical protein
MSMKTQQKISDEHLQTLQTNNQIQPSHVGNSTSLEAPTDNCFIHHRNHRPDAPREEVEEVEEVEEAEEEDYLLQQDQACSHHMDGPLTTTNF